MSVEQSHEDRRAEMHQIVIAAAASPEIKTMYIQGTSGTGKTYCLTKATVALVNKGHVAIVICGNTDMYNGFVSEFENRKNDEDYPEVLKSDKKTIVTLRDLEDITPKRYHTRVPPSFPFPDCKILIGHDKQWFFQQLIMEKIFSHSLMVLDGVMVINKITLECLIDTPIEMANKKVIGSVDTSQPGLFANNNKAYHLIYPSDLEVPRPECMPKIVGVTKFSLRGGSCPSHIEIRLHDTTRPAALLGWVNEVFYNNRLKGADTPANLKFIDTSRLEVGPNETIHMVKRDSGKTVYNVFEAKVAVEEARRMINEGTDPSKIGLMAQGTKQVEFLRAELEKSDVSKDVRVDRTVGYYFKPCENIIFTMTVSSENHKIPYEQLTSHQCNAVFQRATKSLIWIGNGETLVKNTSRIWQFGTLIRFLRGEPMFERNFHASSMKRAAAISDDESEPSPKIVPN